MPSQTSIDYAIMEFAKSIEDEDLFGPIESDRTHEPDSNMKPSLSRLKEKYKQLAKGLVPAKLASDRDENGMIDIEIKSTGPEVNSTAKSIFEKAAQKRVKDKYGLYKGQKLFWNKYNEYLLKKISSEKRKQWDSFQNPTDQYDDEEELIEDIGMDHDANGEDGENNGGDEVVDPEFASKASDEDELRSSPDEPDQEFYENDGSDEDEDVVERASDEDEDVVERASDEDEDVAERASDEDEDVAERASDEDDDIAERATDEHEFESESDFDDDSNTN